MTSFPGSHLFSSPLNSWDGKKITPIIRCLLCMQECRDETELNVNPLLSHRGLFKRERGRAMVSVLHQELEYKVKKLKYKTF